MTFLEDVQDGGWESGGVLWDGDLPVRAEDAFPSWVVQLKDWDWEPGPSELAPSSVACQLCDLGKPPKLSKFTFLINTTGILIHIFRAVSFYKIINVEGVKKCSFPPTL